MFKFSFMKLSFWSKCLHTVTLSRKYQARSPHSLYLNTQCHHHSARTYPPRSWSPHTRPRRGWECLNDNSKLTLSPVSRPCLSLLVPLGSSVQLTAAKSIHEYKIIHCLAKPRPGLAGHRAQAARAVASSSLASSSRAGRGRAGQAQVQRETERQRAITIQAANTSSSAETLLMGSACHQTLFIGHLVKLTSSCQQWMRK